MICAGIHVSRYLQGTSVFCPQVLKQNIVGVRELSLSERLYDGTLLTAYDPRMYFFALNEQGTASEPIERASWPSR